MDLRLVLGKAVGQICWLDKTVSGSYLFRPVEIVKANLANGTAWVPRGEEIVSHKLSPLLEASVT